MRLPEPTSTWLPSTEQLMVASERAILAALDATLELAIRSLKAEHVALIPDGRLSTDHHDEPYTFNLLPIAEALVLCAKRLRQLVTDYRTVSDDLLRVADGVAEKPENMDEDDFSDDDIPF
jgi:hypothetical protein